MRERLYEIVKLNFKKIRPFFIIFLSLSALYSGYLLKTSFIPIQEELVTKISDHNNSLQVSDLEQDQKKTLIKVSITGQVNSPGVYDMQKGSIIEQLIAKAGGLTKSADSAYISKAINLAKQLNANEQIYIPSKTEQKLLDLNNRINISDNSQKVGSDELLSSKININTASQNELEKLDGVGPSTAEKIINNRPYQTIEDIKNVSGIGEVTFEKIKDLIIV